MKHTAKLPTGEHQKATASERFSGGSRSRASFILPKIRRGGGGGGTPGFVLKFYDIFGVIRANGRLML